MKEVSFYFMIIFIVIIIFGYFDEENWGISFILLFFVFISFLYKKIKLAQYENELINKINGNIKYRKELKK